MRDLDDMDIILFYLENISVISLDKLKRYVNIIGDPESKPIELDNIADELYDLYQASILKKHLKLAKNLNKFYNYGLSITSLLASNGYTDEAKDIISDILKHEPPKDILKSIDNLQRFFEL